MAEDRVLQTYEIPDGLDVAAATALYGLEVRLQEVDDDDDVEVLDDEGNVVGWVSNEVEYYEVLRAPTRMARDRWFECPVSGDWLPYNKGVTVNGKRYSPEAAADLIEDRRRSRL